jgi:hypothetical protein
MAGTPQFGDQMTREEIVAFFDRRQHAYDDLDAARLADVALEVLPEAFASDPDRIARFKREAQVLASLNHPNISAIYGLEADPWAHSASSGQAGSGRCARSLLSGGAV